jgi:hypothetical protein
MGLLLSCKAEATSDSGPPIGIRGSSDASWTAGRGLTERLFGPFTVQSPRSSELLEMECLPKSPVEWSAPAGAEQILGLGTQLVRSVGADRVGRELKHTREELMMVHSADVDAQPCVAEHSYQSFREHEVLDRDAPDTGLESPGSERLGRVVGRLT